MRILITGGAGFIGSHFIRYILGVRRDVEVVNLDALTYAGVQESLDGLDANPRYRFVRGDICDSQCATSLVREADAIVNFAAETHVDRSIAFDDPFIRTNVVGTRILLAAAVGGGRRRFVQISSDEVYGELPWRDPDAGREAGSVQRFTETSCLCPRSPYAASKAAADHLALAYFHTYGLDVVITRSSNNYGPYQLPEKLIPLMITNALEGRKLPIYGDGLHVRDWIHVRDHCRGLERVLFDGRAGEVYNFGARTERTNLQVVWEILRCLGKTDDLIEFVTDRAGHDRRYGIDPSKAERELGWRAEIPFEEGLADTVRWYRDNREWWQRAKARAIHAPSRPQARMETP